MNDFIKYLNSYKNYLTKQQFKTLRGKALEGDILAVRKGLAKILNRQGATLRVGRW